MDQSSMNPRRTLAAPAAVAATNNHSSSIYGGGILHGSSSYAVSQPFINVQQHPWRWDSLYSSLPPFAVNPTPPPSQQPPLLPLPIFKTATLPSPSKPIATATAGRSRQHKNKPRSSTGTRKETRSSGSARSEPKPVEKPPGSVKADEEEFLGRSLYSISPPPSSLPLPRFSLTRPKAAAAAAAACNAEAVCGGGGGGVDAGSSDEVGRLLRL